MYKNTVYIIYEYPNVFKEVVAGLPFYLHPAGQPEHDPVLAVHGHARLSLTFNVSSSSAGSYLYDSPISYHLSQYGFNSCGTYIGGDF